VVFGAARFGRSARSKLAPLADKCRKLLEKADKRGDLVLINMDEFNTSQVCSKCGKKNLKKMNIDGGDLYPVAVCQSCATVWQRDVNAARNIRALFVLGSTSSIRPVPFRRPPILSV
jgi:transposase